MVSHHGVVQDGDRGHCRLAAAAQQSRWHDGIFWTQRDGTVVLRADEEVVATGVEGQRCALEVPRANARELVVTADGPELSMSIVGTGCESTFHVSGHEPVDVATVLLDALDLVADSWHQTLDQTALVEEELVVVVLLLVALDSELSCSGLQLF